MENVCAVALTAILAAIAPQTNPSPVDIGLPFRGEVLEVMVVIFVKDSKEPFNSAALHLSICLPKTADDGEG